MQTKSRCPRCGGNQFHVKDQFGEYLSCLQCGRSTDVETSDALREPVGRRGGADASRFPERFPGYR